MFGSLTFLSFQWVYITHLRHSQVKGTWSFKSMIHTWHVLPSQNFQEELSNDKKVSPSFFWLGSRPMRQFTHPAGRSFSYSFPGEFHLSFCQSLLTFSLPAFLCKQFISLWGAVYAILAQSFLNAFQHSYFNNHKKNSKQIQAILDFL